MDRSGHALAKALSNSCVDGSVVPGDEELGSGSASIAAAREAKKARYAVEAVISGRLALGGAEVGGQRIERLAMVEQDAGWDATKLPVVDPPSAGGTLVPKAPGNGSRAPQLLNELGVRMDLNYTIRVHWHDDSAAPAEKQHVSCTT